VPWINLLKPAVRGPAKDIAKASANPTAPSTDERQGVIILHNKANILRKLCHVTLMDNFLESTLETFALTPAEMTQLLLQSYKKEETAPAQDTLKSQIDQYIELVKELSEPLYKYIDFMSVLSSIMFLSDLQIENKIDTIFSYIALGKATSYYQSFTFDDFLIALGSFEAGLSYAMGKRPNSEAYIKDVAKQWMAIARGPGAGAGAGIGPTSPSRGGGGAAGSFPFHEQEEEFSHSQLFELCTNRQHSVRRLLEIIGAAQENKTDKGELHEAVHSDKAQDLVAPSGGDEWLANPAWKKTAENMVPSTATPISSKPSMNLEIDWVHGYRGFDCRNNLTYADDAGTTILFHTASVAIAQVLDGKKTMLFWRTY